MSGKAKFCVFCGSESKNAEMALRQQKLYIEYQQIAALSCMSLELLVDISEESNISLPGLKEQISMHHKEIVELIKNEELREQKFNAMHSIFRRNIASAKIKKEEV